ncbi:peptidylprolyl isomerase [Halovulum dunhuangense]|uniref:Parvulin-like PPIase n=1 Tax=Halovulum dunhuangense TaxID=1505036 RepID=A0A849L355_9RHOB|nr:peptidylprolyl isomerase [Halovulum dunhuangense]NNU80808.1 peptidylprolyl isomerase [Halovulum dunhuangense]
MTFLIRLILPSLLVAATPLIAPAPRAQEAVAPAIMVNDLPITDYEIDQRALLLEALGAPGNGRALAETQLIDDRIRRHEIDRLEIEVTAEELDAGLREFAERRQLDVGQLLAALDERGIAEETMLAFVEPSLGWRKLVQGRFAGQARPTDQDIETALAFASRQTDERLLLQEIAISIEEYGPEEAARLGAELSRSLNRGGNFDAAVARYSRAPSARNGGRLDWVSAGDLPPPIAIQLLALMPGEVSAPIPLGQGISIFRLRDIEIRERPAPEQSADTVVYYELIQPLAADAPDAAVLEARALARDIRQRTRLCTDLDGQLPDFGAGSGRSAPTPIASLPPRLAQPIANMAPGDMEILRDDRGVVLLMLCERSGEATPEEREALRNQLFNQRLSALAQNYLEDLRGDAVIVEK